MVKKFCDGAVDRLGVEFPHVVDSMRKALNAGAIKASFENGVLVLDLPKLETRLPESTRISIE